ncbi:ERF family protein [Lactococcus raffinolactis]|uniref:ERF family protein n=1 Tax=Pseudolactococcus raffinolactis TaxID=1366 RepID=UPI001436798A|nr:ERF family protein [Lactococcus raffinolactis]QIW50759.1 single-stranded DNA-binding protein [Lactococcus raffinolactis]
MSKLKFNELQNKMNLKKQKGQAVNYTYRSAEQILEHFKAQDSGWEVILTDDISEIGGKLFMKSTAIARDADEKHEAIGFAELSEVPILKLKAGGEKKQMTEPQWTGAVSSYARKYALQGLFGIADVDADELELQQEVIQKKEQVKKRDFPKEIKQAKTKDEVIKIAKEAKSFGLGQSILEAYTEKIKEFEG